MPAPISELGTDHSKELPTAICVIFGMRRPWELMIHTAFTVKSVKSSRTRSLQAGQWAECKLLFKTFNRLLRSTAALSSNRRNFRKRIERLERLNDWNLFRIA